MDVSIDPLKKLASPSKGSNLTAEILSSSQGNRPSGTRGRINSTSSERFFKNVFKRQYQDPPVNERRGRHYQTPRRFEFKKNIPFTRSTSLQPSNGKDDILVRRSPSLVRRSARNNSTPELQSSAQQKRHSISVIMSKFESGLGDNAETPKLTNPYNDTKVLETITPNMRSYMLDTLTNHPLAYQPNASPSVGTSGAGGHRKSIAIAVKSTVKTPPTYSSSVSKINHYQAGITSGFKVRQKAETSREPLVVSPLPSSHSVSSGSDSSDASQESSNEDELEDFEDYSDHNGYSSKNTPMRIQQRQLAIQNMMNPSKDAGNAWIKYAADEGKKQERKERVLEDSIESLIQQERENSTDSELSSSQTTIIWSKVGINQRNSYEEISNDLRSLIMFNKKPMMKSIERYARSTAAKDKNFYRAVNEGQKSSSPSAKYLDKHGHFSCRAGSQLSKDLWGKANREYRVDRYHSTL